MDKEMQEIKVVLDGISNCLREVSSQSHDTTQQLKNVAEAVENIGHIGIRRSDVQSYSPPATLGDIKVAIEGLNPHSGYNSQLQEVIGAINSLTTAVETLVEVQYQMLTAKNDQAAEYEILPWSKHQSEPHLKYGWDTAIEPGQLKLSERGM